MTQALSGRRRFLALVFPWLAADLFRLSEGKTGAGESPASASPDRIGPLVFTVKQRGAFRLHALDEAALALGLEPGMPLADARARVPDLLAIPHDAEGEAALMARLAAQAGRFSPMVAVDAPEALVLDISGCAHLFGGEAALAREASRFMARQAMRVVHARADTPEAALALARFGYEDADTLPLPHAGGGRGVGFSRPDFRPTLDRSRVTPIEGGQVTGKAHPPAPSRAREGEKMAISRLPLLALRMEADVVLALRRAGFTCIGDLAALPPAPLAARFGAGMVDALDRLLGRADSRIVPRRTLPAIMAERRFAEPVARVETMMAVLGELLETVCETLRERHEGGRRFAARLFRSDGAVRDLAVETGAPVRTPAIVQRLFAERIEALADPLDPGFGFDMLRLAVPLSEPLAAAQDGLIGGRSGAHELAALLDRLGTRLGAQLFSRLAPQESHVPERATQCLPAGEAIPAAWDAPPPGEPPLRPLALFDPPERIEVLAAVPDGPPRSFRWRGGAHRVVAQEGPERIAPEWWRRSGGHQADPGLTRDYYRVEDEAGQRFWLFRHGLYERETNAPLWYVHGLFA